MLRHSLPLQVWRLPVRPTIPSRESPKKTGKMPNPALRFKADYRESGDSGTGKRGGLLCGRGCCSNVLRADIVRASVSPGIHPGISSDVFGVSGMDASGEGSSGVRYTDVAAGVAGIYLPPGLHNLNLEVRGVPPAGPGFGGQEIPTESPWGRVATTSGPAVNSPAWRRYAGCESPGSWSDRAPGARSVRAQGAPAGARWRPPGGRHRSMPLGCR